MVFQNIMMGAAGAGGGYEINQSIRFNSADSSYLTKTFGADGGDTWTFSLWIKRGKITSGGNWYFFSEAGGSGIGFVDGTDKLRFYNASSVVDSTQVFRDPSAWYHFVFSNNAGTVTITVNNTAVEIGSTTATLFNRNNAWHIGSYYDGGNNFDGYMAEMNWIDGTALAPTDFGETNDDGVWVPKKYTGSYGTNGFYITGADSADLGADYSGNNNDFTSSGLTSDDQVSDSPTLNFPVISPIDYQTGSNVTISNGNLTFQNANSGSANDARATFAVSSGKWYWEVEADSLGQSGVNREFIGIVGTEFDITAGSAGASFSADSTGYAFATTGQKINNNSAASYGSAFTAGQYIGVALDLDNGKIYWSINGTFQNSGDPAGGTGEAYSSISGTFAPAFAVDYGTGNSTLIANFGQSSFQNSPPSGFKAINSANLPAPDIIDGTAHFNATAYTGNGSSGHSITNDANSGNFQPDVLLISPRSNGDNHVMWDVARGITSRIYTNKNDAQDTDGTALVTFEANGFDLDTTDPNYNGSGRTYVGWQWKTQGGAGSSNTDGSISTTTTSLNSTSKFSISTYTGTGSNATIGHGLGTAPQVIWIKRRDSSAGWAVYHSGLASTSKYLVLNATDAEASSSNYWNTTAPTSSVISIGTDNAVNASSGTYVAYAFAEVEGYSKFSKFTGNGSTDGAFIYTGFKPACVIIKRFNSTGDWVIIDNQRVGYNPDNNDLDINNSDSEGTNDYIDILTNGFKCRSSDSNVNADGSTYVVMAFAEMPFGGADISVATAR